MYKYVTHKSFLIQDENIERKFFLNTKHEMIAKKTRYVNVDKLQTTIYIK